MPEDLIDVRMPDGTIVRNVPSGTSKMELTRLLAVNRLKEGMAQQAPAVDRAVAGEPSGDSAFTRAMGTAGRFLGGMAQATPPGMAFNAVANPQANLDLAKGVGSQLLNATPFGAAYQSFKGRQAAMQGNAQEAFSRAGKMLGPADIVNPTMEEAKKGLPEGITAGALNLGTVLAAAKGPALAEKIPTKAGAIENFEAAAKEANPVPLDTSGMQQVAKRVMELKGRGFRQIPYAVADFVKRMRDETPMTYEEGRDFYKSATGKLSAEEAAKLRPEMRAQLVQFRNALKQSLSDAAGAVGKRAEFEQAVTEFHRAMALRRFGAKAGAAAMHYLPYGLGGLALGAGAEAYRELTK